MHTIYYVPAACRERCTAGLINVRLGVILKFCFQNLLAFKYQRDTQFVRVIAEIVSSIIILRRLSCPLCLMLPCNGLFLCFEPFFAVGSHF
jgi:hypothetical protein